MFRICCLSPVPWMTFDVGRLSIITNPTAHRKNSVLFSLKAEQYLMLLYLITKGENTIMKHMLNNIDWTVIRWKILSFLSIQKKTTYVFKQPAREQFDAILKKIINNDYDPEVFDRYSEIMHAVGCVDVLTDSIKILFSPPSFNQKIDEYLEYLGEELRGFLQALADNATLSCPELFPLWSLDLNKLLTEIPTDVSSLLDFEIRLTYFKVRTFASGNSDVFDLRMYYRQTMVNRLSEDVLSKDDALDKIDQLADLKGSMLSHLFCTLSNLDTIPVEWKINILQSLRIIPKKPSEMDWLTKRFWTLREITQGNYNCGSIL